MYLSPIVLCFPSEIGQEPEDKIHWFRPTDQLSTHQPPNLERLPCTVSFCILSSGPTDRVLLFLTAFQRQSFSPQALLSVSAVLWLYCLRTEQKRRLKHLISTQTIANATDQTIRKRHQPTPPVPPRLSLSLLHTHTPPYLQSQHACVSAAPINRQHHPFGFCYNSAATIQEKNHYFANYIHAEGGSEVNWGIAD